MKTTDLFESEHEILVQGVGKYTLEQVQKNVQGKLNDLAKRGNSANTMLEWRNILHLFENGATVPMLKAIVKEMERLENEKGE